MSEDNYAADTEQVKQQVQEVRALESNARENLKNANSIVKLRGIAVDSTAHAEPRMAAIHALRRTFTCYAENGWNRRSVSEKKSDSLNTKDRKDSKAKEYNQWFVSQYQSFLKALLDCIADSSSQQFHALAIRTYMEMLKQDSILSGNPSSAAICFNKGAYCSLLRALLIDSKSELDVDLLLMLKEEFLSFHDCSFHSLSQLKLLISEFRAQYQKKRDDAAFGSAKITDDQIRYDQIIMTNFLDIMRVMEVPAMIDDENFFLPQALQSSRKKTGVHKSVDEDSDEGSSGSDSSNDEDVMEQKVVSKKVIDPLVAELAGLSKDTLVDDNGQPSTSKQKKRKRRTKPLSEKLMDPISHQKLFSAAWLKLLSLPFSTSQHKVLLRHIPERVLPYLVNPLLLSDYLTVCYNVGGVVAVLALESLFQLIVQYNLDYPKFFLSLYNLCTVQVFTAKYRNKFMKLLNLALKSVNIPAYMVAAFIKRLARLAICTLTPNAQFCISQGIWLLRQHPQSQVLIHRVIAKDGLHDFQNSEQKDFEKIGALQSSLWEMQLLQKHHIYNSASIAMQLEQNHAVTMSGEEVARSIAKASDKHGQEDIRKAYVHVEDYLDVTYDTLVANEMKNITGSHSSANTKNKFTAALSYQNPRGLFGDESDAIFNQCFG